MKAQQVNFWWFGSPVRGLLRTAETSQTALFTEAIDTDLNENLRKILQILHFHLQEKRMRSERILCRRRHYKKQVQCEWVYCWHNWQQFGNDQQYVFAKIADSVYPLAILIKLPEADLKVQQVVRVVGGKILAPTPAIRQIRPQVTS